MIGAFRRSRLLLVTALVALLSVIPMAALPLLHGGGDDPACDPRTAAHDGSAHHVNGQGTVPADAQHCIVCHWSRWVRAIQDDAPALTPSFDSGPVATACVAQPRTTAASRSSARAPPLS